MADKKNALTVSGIDNESLDSFIRNNPEKARGIIRAYAQEHAGQIDLDRIGDDGLPAVDRGPLRSAMNAIADEEMRRAYATIWQQVDKSANITNPSAWDANQDFIAFKDTSGSWHIEIQRNLAMKLMWAFNMGKSDIQIQTTETSDGDVLVSVQGTVTLTIGGHERSTEVTGGCSTSEAQSGRKSKNKRAYHDAVAIAETRMLKRGVEELVGAAVVNALIKEIWGGYELNERKMRNVSPKEKQKKPQQSSESKPADTAALRQLRTDIQHKLRILHEHGRITQEDAYQRWERVKANARSESVLQQIASDLDGMISQGASGEESSDG